MNMKTLSVLALAVMVLGCMLILTDDDVRADSVTGTGTISDPYTAINIDAENSGDYFTGTKYVLTGSSVSINSHLDDVYDYYVKYQSPSHGLTWSYGSLTGTLSGSNNDVFTYEVRVTIDEQEDILVGNYSFTIITAPVKYTVTWKNWDGTTLETDTNVNYGTMPTYDGATPARASSGPFSYTFTGWSPTVSTVTGNQTYTAQFSQTFNESVIGSGTPNDPYTKVNIYAEHSGTYFTGTKYVSTGADIYLYSHTVDTNEYYIVSHVAANGINWSYGSLIGTVTGSNGNTFTYTVRVVEDEQVQETIGQYTFTVIDTSTTYTITWKNYDGTTLETDTGVRYGVTPSYDGATPARASTQYYSYAFDGWSPTVGVVTGSRTYTASFVQSLIPSVIGTGSPNDPYTELVINADSSADYLTGTKYIAVGSTVLIYSRTVGTNDYYVASHVAANGINWSYGSLTGTVSGSNGNTFTYTLRVVEDEQLDEVVGQYSFIVTDPNVTYTVTWKNWDGTTLETDTGQGYAVNPSYGGATPTKSATAQYTFTFTGWSPAVSPVYGDQTYTAQFSQSLRSYTVIWENYDNTVLETDTVAYGSVPTYDGATPTKPPDGGLVFTFSGWSPTVSAVTGDQTYTAQFTNTSYVTGDWGYDLDDNGNATILSYTGAGGTVQIPQTVDGFLVTSISDTAFSGNSDIKAIVIPPTVTEIEAGAFTGTAISEVLNLSGISIGANSYGLSGAMIHTEIGGIFYLSNVTYTEDVNKNDPASIIIRIIPLSVLLGLFIFIFYRLRDKDNYE